MVQIPSSEAIRQLRPPCKGQRMMLRSCIGPFTCPSLKVNSPRSWFPNGLKDELSSGKKTRLLESLSFWEVTVLKLNHVEIHF